MLSKILSSNAGGKALRWSLSAPGGQAPACSEASEPAKTDPQTEQHLAEAEQKAEQRMREARQGGYREGEAAGRKQAEAAVQATVEKLAQSIAEIAALRPRLMREAEADLVELSIGIARRILRRELSVDPDALEGLVHAALEKLPGQQILRIRVHGELEPALRRALEKAGRRSIAIAADGTLERGSVWVETGRGKLDASLETQLAEIGRGLTDRLGER